MASTYNLRGTINPSFQVGKQGITVYQGTAAPSGGADGDMYVRNGASIQRLYQKAGSSWIQLQSTRKVTQSKTADYTTQEPDEVIFVDTTSNIVTITLGTSSVAAGKQIQIKDSGANANTNNITIATQASELIDGQVSILIDIDYKSVILISNGTDWYII